MHAVSSIRTIAKTTPLIGASAPKTDQLHRDEQSQVLTFEYAKFVNQHSTDYIRMADSKAAVLITLLSANLLVLVQRTGDAITALHNPGVVFLLVAACIYVTLGLGVAVNIIRPRLFRNASHGHIFWEDIAAQEKHRYAASMQDLSVGQIYQELGEHNHNLANTALRKFKWLRFGFTMAMTSIVLSASILLAIS